MRSRPALVFGLLAAAFAADAGAQGAAPGATAPGQPQPVTWVYDPALYLPGETPPALPDGAAAVSSLVDQAMAQGAQFWGGLPYAPGPKGYARVDLNGDGAGELIVSVRDDDVCRADACPTFVFAPVRGGWTPIGSFAAVQVAVGAPGPDQVRDLWLTDAPEGPTVLRWNAQSRRYESAMSPPTDNR